VSSGKIDCETGAFAQTVAGRYGLPMTGTCELISEPMTKTAMIIGVLALQGDFDAHRRRLEELGATVVLVKKAEQFDEINGLVIPGGESGTFLKLLGQEGFAKLKEFVHAKPSFGTCAGAILLATEVENPQQAGLGAIDIRIRRNAYGRQIDSSIREGRLVSKDAKDSPLEMVFIRAPRIEHIGPGVEVLAKEGEDIVAVRQGRVMAATFHPELSEDTRVHRAFLDLVANAVVGDTSGVFSVGPSPTDELIREWGKGAKQ
jgi:5'-phosphate synthase pdxT subunit